MSLADMKRINDECTLFEANSPVKKQNLCVSSAPSAACFSLKHEQDMLERLESSDIISEESEECETETSSPLSSSEELTKNHVSFNDSVAMRVVYYSSDEDEDDEEKDGENNESLVDEESVDSVIGLKKEDNSTPRESVKFDEEEEAIRKQLVGCICAPKHKKHNYAAMYGCGPSLKNDDESSSDDDDEDFEFSEPPRLIIASAPSASWFTL